MTTTDRVDLPGRVRTALRHQADALVVADRAFDPDAPGIVIDGSRTVGPPRHRLVAAAAALVLVGLAAGLVVARAADHGEQTRAQQPPTAATPTTAGHWRTTELPDGATSTGALAALVPQVVPEGMEPTALAVEDATHQQLQATQLFATPDGSARVRITVQAGRGDTTRSGPTVRGQPAGAMPSKQLPDTSSALMWHEGAHAYTADHRGLTQAEAVAFLDALVPRTLGDTTVFDVAPGALPGGLALVSEAVGAAVSFRTTSLTYEGAAGRIDVRAAAPLEGDDPYGRVQAAYLGSEDAEGRIVSYDPRYDEVQVVWPDGQGVLATGDGTIGEATLREVALSVVPIDGAELADRQAELAGDGPLLAVEVPAAEDVPPNVGQPSAEVHLQPPDGATLCIALDGGAPHCDPASTFEGVATLVLDGTWYVAVARTDGSRITLGAPGPGADPAVPPGVRRADVDGLHVELVALPEDVDRVFVGTDEYNGEVVRPTG